MATKSNPKVVGYIRVSTAEQAADGVSLAAQEHKIRAYCDLYDLELLHVYSDEGESGKDLVRSGLKAALRDLTRSRASGIVVAKLDRLTRSIVDLNNLISEYFGDKAKQPASLYSVADQIDTRSASGRLVLNVLMSVAQWERETIGERTREALAHKKAKGERISRHAPYGWKVGPDGVRLVVNVEEQEAALIAKQYRKEGLSLRDIGYLLDDQGRFQRNGKPWSASTVKRLLKTTPPDPDGLTQVIVEVTPEPNSI